MDDTDRRACWQNWLRRLSSGTGGHHAQPPGMNSRYASGPCAIIVLGFPSRRNGRLHAIQKWRTEIGVRSRSDPEEHVLMSTGGRSRRNLAPEAETMASYAQRPHVPGDQLLLESTSANTWQNLGLTLPTAASFDMIVIASDPLHAARARRYVVAQQSGLVDRLVFADDYRFLEEWWLKIPTATYGFVVVIRDFVLKCGPNQSLPNSQYLFDSDRAHSHTAPGA